MTDGVRTVALKGVRGMIADAMVKSLATAAQLAEADPETGLPVVGIAKTAFRGAGHAGHAVPVLRGRSAKPLLQRPTIA